MRKWNPLPARSRAATEFAVRSLARMMRQQRELEKHPRVLNLPPFPKLTLTTSNWVGEDVLKAWAGFGARRGSKGKVGVSVHRAPGDDDANPVPPAREMVAAYRHLKEHQAEVRDAVLEAFRSYINDTLIGEHGWKTEPMEDGRALKKVMEISSVHPWGVAKKGMAYVGLFFHCTWDPEHAAGALVHGSRVIKVGDNEATGDTFAAMEDGGKEIRRWKWRH